LLLFVLAHMSAPHTFDATDVECATTLRLLAADAIQAANSGHPGLPFGAADIAHVILSRYVKSDPSCPTWADRDRFVLSGGHGSSLLYAYLACAGYDYTPDDLRLFRKIGSKCPGHPEYNPAMGIEVTTGPLGQGFACSVGMALAEKVLEGHFGSEVFNHRIWTLCGDGDLMEGVSHEAASFAGHFKLDNLVVLYDDNGISIDGPITCTCTDDAVARFAALGWDVRSCDGNDMASVDKAVAAALEVKGKPHFIACKTKIGLKTDWEGTAKVHGTPLGVDQLARVKTAYGRDPKLEFYIPDCVRERYAESAKRGKETRAAWEKRVETFKASKTPKVAVYESLEKRELPCGWDAEGIPKFAMDGESKATRQWSQKVIEAFMSKIPAPLVIGGSADLTGSNLTRASTCTDITDTERAGNYVHYGIREHVMGQIMNGLATYGIRPYGATFLAFSDYMRPAIRAAALMHLPVIFQFTHDSIGHGEDGPTHQPVEHLLSLRAIPNVVVLRPADANETAAAWKIALERRDGPTILAFSRQAVVQAVSAETAMEGVKVGGYVVPEDPAEPKVAILATGSEVGLACAARKILADEGVAARVVSLPSFELFDAQPEEYRKKVMPEGLPRLGLEAGRTIFTWEHYRVDAAMGVDTFGESGPHKAVYQHFGLTAEKVAAKAKEIAKH